MKIVLLPFLFFSLAGCASYKKEQEKVSLEISEIAPNKASALTRQNLLQLVQVYDLAPFLFTRKVIIESKRSAPFPQSVTLLTTDAEDPMLLLSDFLNEQFNYWLDQNKEKVSRVKAELKMKFPRRSSKDPQELIARFLEFRALKHLLGNSQGTQILKLKKIQDTSYQELLIHGARLEQILKENALIPEVLL